ncbi:MAG: Ldh family oxidoreductase [Rhodobacteraceae bacterium]|jgi:LDH2 family malate/lactate/ureidoglycolate dehydrogenase|nr:Ldh family oxidoreductase [Paracoccaceae bacterium]
MSDVKDIHAQVGSLDSFSRQVFQNAGVDALSSDAATRAMLHGSIHGVDSHGIRLLAHYVKAFQGGRLNKRPKVTIIQERSGTAVLDADNAHGAVGAFAAIEHAIGNAKAAGIAAVAIQNTSHFGPAGAFSKAAADAGMIALVFGNSDSFVRLFDGAEPFHGTNPISVAVPSGQDDPWLLDMATSSVPFNRVELHRSLQRDLAKGVASDSDGRDTTDPFSAEMLAPVGGSDFGFKGAALGGVAEIFSAVLTGMKLSPDIAPMVGPDFLHAREMGAFVIVMDPVAFVAAPLIEAGMTRYLSLLRGSKPRAGQRVMAPGDREWARAAQRQVQGIPLDPVTVANFSQLAEDYKVKLPWNTD